MNDNKSEFYESHGEPKKRNTSIDNFFERGNKLKAARAVAAKRRKAKWDDENKEWRTLLRRNSYLKNKHLN